MNVFKYVIFFIVLIILSSIYKKLKLDENKNTSEYYYKMVDRYLLNKTNLGIGTKPFLWIHLHNDNTITPAVNARHWLSFGSRATQEFNQPYQLLTIKSIINKCGDDFNICLIDDDSFDKILPDWKINLNNMSNPIKTHIRLLALASVLNIYGGILVPSSFICFDSLISLYNDNFTNNKMFVGEFLNRTASQQLSNNVVIPTPFFMGCNANNHQMKQFVNFLEILNSTDFTAQHDFLGRTNEWLSSAASTNEINIINGEFLGTQKADGSAIYANELLGSSYIELNNDALGLYIPWDELLNRPKLQWFPRLSPKQVLESDTVIGKHLLINSE